MGPEVVKRLSVAFVRRWRRILTLIGNNVTKTLSEDKKAFPLISAVQIITAPFRTLLGVNQAQRLTVEDLP